MTSNTETKARTNTKKRAKTKTEKKNNSELCPGHCSGSEKFRHSSGGEKLDSKKAKRSAARDGTMSESEPELCKSNA